MSRFISNYEDTTTTDGKTITAKYIDQKYEIRKEVYVAQESINEIADAVVRKLKGKTVGVVISSDMSDEDIEEQLKKLEATWIIRRE